MHAMTPIAPQKRLLRFFIGGSVDVGKSTLLGRLMHEAGAVADDQLVALKRDSSRLGTTGDTPAHALPVDSLEDKRKQGIAIDVAHRYFATAQRAFAVADTPGHEANIRNAAVDASTAELAVIVVDARHGLSSRTRRHALVARTVGVRHMVLAVNKLDRVGWDQIVFDAIAKNFDDFTQSLDIASLIAIPLSALNGDNVTMASNNAPWYSGPTLLAYLEAIDVDSEQAQGALRLPIQSVLEPGSDSRLYAGTIAGGTLRRGETVQAAISKAISTIDHIYVAGSERDSASVGDAVSVALREPIDVGRGDILAPPHAGPEVSEQFEAHLVWMGEQPLLPGRDYLLQIATQSVSASVTAVRYRIDADTQHRDPVHTLALNEIGVCDIATAAPVAFDSFASHPRTGCFILIDRYSNATVGAGTIDFALRRGKNVTVQPLTVAKGTRAAIKAQRPCILWFTGLSGAGKSTIANLVESKLAALDRHAYILDGDNIRHGLNKNLGFTNADRVENIRRVGEVAKLFVDAGLIVLCSFISPFRAERVGVRELIEPGEFIEIFVNAPLAVCEARDPKGLYAKSRAGQLPNFTGIDSPYEMPDNPDLVLMTDETSPDELAQRVIDLLVARGHIGAAG